MPYRNAPIVLEDGVWIGAKTVVCSGVICKSHSVLTAGSVATKDLEEFTMYQGNPAIALKKRVIK
jgi:putative colanic acid biosynthesis acetyltransferase WcaF